MAAVLSTRQKTLNRAAVTVVVLLTLVYLVPIYWITSTAFKPRSLATTVPPTVLFEPEVTAFIKLFTKRVQMLGQVDPEVYQKAPWWEQRIYDQGERFIKDANGKIEQKIKPSARQGMLLIKDPQTQNVDPSRTVTVNGLPCRGRARSRDRRGTPCRAARRTCGRCPRRA